MGCYFLRLIYILRGLCAVYSSFLGFVSFFIQFGLLLYSLISHNNACAYILPLTWAHKVLYKH